MIMLIAATLLYILVIAICITVIIKGHSLNFLERKIKNVIVRDKAPKEEEISEKDYHQAYEIIDDLAVVLECTNDMVKYNGVKSVFKRVEAFRDQKQDTKHELESLNDIEHKIPSDKKANLWVVK
ncbi:hypothetical protein N473_12460 [Pseudoalteromonas luteoviolacea CPMOR-1]|uniref:Uncharacterized protein n=1 Tax=Pseudoalteromonas luteoviolacea CPMOR-1 TaxID=1365248 RepID=A0A167LY31_9GAMM|nr:hypothetical protein [Pseudoalteromonas luteoviolacea]KZN65518.1 hypothetical protein N473_12460 [Pseudoalteromonas luteoviolacea CPMOR-1]